MGGYHDVVVIEPGRKEFLQPQAGTDASEAIIRQEAALEDQRIRDLRAELRSAVFSDGQSSDLDQNFGDIPAVNIGRMDGFANLRYELEQRRKTYQDELARAMSDVDIDLVTREEPKGLRNGGPQDADVNFELRGALPPTTNTRTELATLVAIAHNEKQVAVELIHRGQEASRASSRQSADAVRRGRRRRPDVGLPSRGIVALVPFEHCGRAFEHSERLIPSPYPPCDWETKTLQYHRFTENAEREADIADKLARQRVAQRLQGERRQALHFQLSHKRREAAITSRKKVMDTRDAYDEYKSKVHEQLVTHHVQNQHSRYEVKLKAQEEKERGASRRQMRESLGEFCAEISLMDKTCRVLDRENRKALRKNWNEQKVKENKERWAGRTASLESKHRMIAAQRKAMDSADSDRLRFAEKMRIDVEVQAHRQRQTQIKARHNVDRYLQDAREELVAHEQGLKTITMMAPNDVEAYANTLDSFRQLAEDVNEFGKELNAAVQGSIRIEPKAESETPGDTPLAALEPRVRALFDEEDDIAANDSAEDSAQGDHVQDLKAFDSARRSIADLRSQPLRIPSSSKGMPTVPLVDPVDTSAQNAPLTTRPLLSLTQQVPGTKLYGEPSQHNVNSLAALRKIRKTGPFTAR